MRVAFFDAQWLVLSRRWPWHPGEEEAMRFYRDRLKARALHIDEAVFGTAVEKLCSSPYHVARPSIDTLIQTAVPVLSTYRPHDVPDADERKQAAERLCTYRAGLKLRIAAHETARRAKPELDAEREAIRDEAQP